jgi:hypothetical protein
MKLENASMSEMTAGFEMPLDVVEGVVVKLRLSLGVGVKRRLGVSSRSCGNSWFEIPISTLWASSENMSKDLFCAVPPEPSNSPVVRTEIHVSAEVSVRMSVNTQLGLRRRQRQRIGRRRRPKQVTTKGSEVIMENAVISRVDQPKVLAVSGTGAFVAVFFLARLALIGVRT